MDFWAYFFFRIILNTYICDGLIISLTVWCVLNSSSLYIFIYTHFIGASFFLSCVYPYYNMHTYRDQFLLWTC